MYFSFLSRKEREGPRERKAKPTDFIRRGKDKLRSARPRGVFFSVFFCRRGCSSFSFLGKRKRRTKKKKSVIRRIVSVGGKINYEVQDREEFFLSGFFDGGVLFFLFTGKERKVPKERKAKPTDCIRRGKVKKRNLPQGEQIESRSDLSPFAPPFPRGPRRGPPPRREAAGAEHFLPKMRKGPLRVNSFPNPAYLRKISQSPLAKRFDLWYNRTLSKRFDLNEIQGYSSAGRAAVSKTACPGFDP